MYRGAWLYAYKDGPTNWRDVPPGGWLAILVAALVVLAAILSRC